MEVRDQSRALKSKISNDGEVKTYTGTLLGFINADATCGDANESFLGEVNPEGQVLDGDGNLVGKVDLLTGDFKDANGSHFGSIKNTGEIFDKYDGLAGTVSNFDFHKLRVFACYIYLLDKSFIAGSSDDKPKATTPVETKPKPKPVETVHESVNLTTPQQKSNPPPQQNKQDIVHEPVSLNLQSTPKPAAQDPDNRVYKKYRVGEFKGIEAGTKNLLEIFDCDCNLYQLSVRIERNGEQVVFLRNIYENGHKKQQAQRFTLPYFMSEDRIKVTYEKNREGGTLSIIMTKPGIGSGSSSGPASGQFTSFVVQGNGSATTNDKVTMGAAQTASYFSFTAQGSCKFDTEMTGELTNGSTIKFHATVTDTVEQVRKKATQTFTLPGPVTMENIEVTDGGKAVKVYMKKTAAEAKINAADVKGAQPDVDVKIDAI